MLKLIPRTATFFLWCQDLFLDLFINRIVSTGQNITHGVHAKDCSSNVTTWCAVSEYRVIGRVFRPFSRTRTGLSISYVLFRYWNIIFNTDREKWLKTIFVSDQTEHVAHKFVLRQMFPTWLVSNKGDVGGPRRLISACMVLFLWVKEKVFKRHTLEDLKERIAEEV